MHTITNRNERSLQSAHHQALYELRESCELRRFDNTVQHVELQSSTADLIYQWRNGIAVRISQPALCIGVSHHA